MDKNRFKRRSDNSAVVKQPVPKLDEMGELRIVNDETVDSPSDNIKIITENKPEPAPKLNREENIDKNVTDGDLAKDEVVSKKVQETPKVSQMKVTAASILNSAAIPAIASPSTQETNININISLPKIPELKLKKPTLPALPNLPYKKIAIYSSIAIAALAIVISSIVLLNHHTTKLKPVVSTSDGHSPNLGLSTPTFTPVAPKDKPQLAKGISGTTFDGSRDSYSFTDVLNGTPLVVSQQPIPSKYNSPTAAVEAAAKSIGATTVLPTNNIEAYMATNNTSKSQIIVFSMKDILLFIQSYFTHPASIWADYINNLN